MKQGLEDVYIVAAQRTPVGKAMKGGLRQVRPDDLLAHAMKGVMKEAAAVEAARIDDVIVGCAMPEGAQGMNVARLGVLMAGLPETVPALTINRFCCSGVQSMAMAADRIARGDADAILAGGVESMSLVPMGGHQFSANPKWFEQNEHLAIAYGMGLTAERVAEKWQISRERQDVFAYESHQKAVSAIEKSELSEEILPYTVTQRVPDLQTGEINETAVTIEQDEGPRADTSVDALARLRPVFAQGGSVTAGNSSQMSDGAGMALLVSGRLVKELQLEPIARFAGYEVAGVSPEIMGIGPIAAIPRLLQKTGLKQTDFSWIELNEAFAAQSLAVMDELDLPAEHVNPLGGAIALGHPLGATGAIRVATLVHGLRRRKQRWGMVTMCIGTGMGAAAAIESLSS